MRESIGVQKDAIPLDTDFHPWYSWRCKCGEYQDMYPFRWLARMEYKEHRATCGAHLTKRAADVDYCMCDNTDEIDEYRLDGVWVCYRCSRPRSPH